ncbi:MAG: hypothetical protein NT099_06395, partial [Candidatus Saganbacteria bacterium]|nr:hypothetical protein [Candidatus Saganbacteria bacterium]
MGVYGYASNSGAGFNFGGYFAAAGTNGTGIYGQAPKTGILGYADGATGKGVFGSADGANGSGVYGQASQATGYAGYFKGGRGISVEGNAFITGEVTATAFHGDGSDLSNVNTTIADNAITTAKITAEAVTNGKIASNAITSAKITAEAVTSGKIASNAVTTVKITDGAITEPKLSITNEATAGKYLSWNGNYMEWLAVSGGSTAEVDNETIGLNASGSLEVKNSAITIGKIATTNIATGEKYLKYTGSNLMWATVSGGGSTSREPDYITIGLTDVYASLEVLDAAITNAKIGPAAVTADKLADGSITATKITDEAVTSGKIASNAITSEKITNEAVTAAKIAAGAVTSSKLASNAAVLSIATTGSSELTGAVELKPGTNITLTQTGNTIEVSASGGGSGTVTSISTGTGLTGGPITVSGIISVESGGIGATQLADSAVTSGKLASDINIVTTGTVSSTANVAERGAVSGLNPNSQGAGLYGEGGVGIYAKTISDNYYSGMFSGGVGISVEGGIGATGIATAAAFSGSGAGLTNIPATSIADGSITGAKLASDINVITTGVVTSTANVAQAGAVSGLNSNAEGAGLFGEGSVGVYAHSTGSSGNAYSGWFRGGVGVSVEGGLGATGIVTAAAFSGNGSGLTNVPATSLADGSIANAKLAGSITGDKLAFNIGINTTGTITAGAISGTINADTVDGFHATSEAAANKLLALNSNKQFILSNNIMSPYIPLIDVNVDGVDAPLGMRVRTAGIYGIAISGEATNTDANTNYGGMFSAAASNGRGVYGIASGDYGIGVYGAATKNSVQTNPNYGGYFLSNGFYGVGVYAEQSGGDGVAVYGKTTSGSGQSIAGKFVNQSGDANSAGISVEAVNKGGFFHASANSGTGIQSYGGNYGGYFESTYGESVTKGIYAKTNSPDGYAGYFEGGEGVYVSGSLESTGRITAVSFTGSGAGLTNIPATSIADGSITGAKLASNINVVTTGNVSSTASVADAGAVTGLNPNANGAGLYGEGKVGVYAKSTGNYYSGMFVGG